MNARLYDPKLHRFLAPDNFIRDPSNSQNYNRYGYVWNNPLRYNDESGEFIFTAVTAVFNAVKEFVQHGVNFDHYDWHQTNMAWKIDKGLVTGSFLDIVSKWTWQSTQTFLGNTINHIINLSGNVTEVTHFDGAVAVSTTSNGGAFTMGNYITGPRSFRADWRDHLFVHEYGHYLQSKYLGPLYLSTVAIPSVMDFYIEPDRHHTRWYEAMASSLGGKYFDKHYGSGAAGYEQGSINFFDLNSYRNERTESPYMNPRNGGYNRGGNTSHYRLHWSDLGYFLFGRIF